MSEADCQLLGVPYPSDLAQVKARWQKLALELHPDHGGDADKFIEALAAYRRLCDEFGTPTCDMCHGKGFIMVTNGFHALRMPCMVCGDGWSSSFTIVWSENT